MPGHRFRVQVRLPDVVSDADGSAGPAEPVRGAHVGPRAGQARSEDHVAVGDETGAVELDGAERHAALVRCDVAAAYDEM